MSDQASSITEIRNAKEEVIRIQRVILLVEQVSIGLMKYIAQMHSCYIPYEVQNIT